MASNGIAAGGTLLKLGDQAGTSGTTYTTIAEVVDITGPGLSADTSDVTSHDSFVNEGGWEEHVVTVLRSGEVTFDINYVPDESTHSSASGMLGELDGGAKKNYELVFSNSGATTWNFDAIVTGFEPSAPHDDKLSASLTLKVTGQPTLA
ncbi:MAG: phage tail tube protein [Bacillota bacterium]